MKAFVKPSSKTPATLERSSISPRATFMRSVSTASVMSACSCVMMPFFSALLTTSCAFAKSWFALVAPSREPISASKSCFAFSAGDWPPPPFLGLSLSSVAVVVPDPDEFTMISGSSITSASSAWFKAFTRSAASIADFAAASISARASATRAAYPVARVGSSPNALIWSSVSILPCAVARRSYAADSSSVAPSSWA